ncbi:double-strand break repair protein MRE11 [Prorops nasuta]|uniref:double-strand break repair protein MRE11 n=1 Tax=Prorops nasuta TaxID=863751 RepID=UPI0034CD7544
MSKDSEKADPNDTIKILIATDCHLGYEDSKKGFQDNDSIKTFEEILKHGCDNKVDFILLGGDLFHDTKPSQHTIKKCIDLLRKYCLGPGGVNLRFLSEPEIIFKHCFHKTVNFDDPNLNVKMPVFTIHGNHDDPNFSATGSLDILSSTGLVNYFGKWTDLAEINISPIILKKGNTYISLYGLGYVNDQRLSRLMRDCKFNLMQAEDIQSFNIFVLHQNRVKRRDQYGYIPEDQLPEFLHFILWGHEHKCRITPEQVPNKEYFVCQPGSSVATSCCESESIEKFVGLLEINKLNFRFKKLPLKTVRPLIFDNLILSEHELEEDYTRKLSDCVCEYIDKHIENELIPKAAEKLTGHPDQPKQPIIRLRIFYSKDEEVFNAIRLSQKYCDEVVNPTEMIIFKKQKDLNHSSLNGDNSTHIMDDENDIFDDLDTDSTWGLTVQDGIKKFFANSQNMGKLTVLSLAGLNEALTRFVTMNDHEAFNNLIKYQMDKTMDYLNTKDVTTDEDIYKEIKSFAQQRLANEESEESEAHKMLAEMEKKKRERTTTELDKTIEEFANDIQVTGRGRGRGRARGRGKVTGSRGKTTSRDLTFHNIIDIADNNDGIMSNYNNIKSDWISSASSSSSAKRNTIENTKEDKITKATSPDKGRGKAREKRKLKLTFSDDDEDESSILLPIQTPKDSLQDLFSLSEGNKHSSQKRQVFFIDDSD